MQTTDLNEQFYALLDCYCDFSEPLENWDTDDLIDLQLVISAALQERDRISQNEYFESQQDEGFEQDEDWKCVNPLCPCNYGGTA